MSSTVPPNFLSRHLLDSVLHSNPVRAFIFPFVYLLYLAIIIIIIIQPLQLGVACNGGAEKIAHALRGCIQEHWMDEDFVVLKVDMRNAFNMVSRHASCP